MDDDERRARLEALFEAHARTVLAYARRRTDHASAADVLSDVFVVAWQRLERIPEDALPWLLACARRTLANHQRGERRRHRLVERLMASTPRIASPAPEIPDDALAQALATLSERDREALFLTEWEGLSAKQAARALGCSPQAFWVRSHRARSRLAAALDHPTNTITLEATP